MKGAATFVNLILDQSGNGNDASAGKIEITEKRTKEKDVGFYAIIYYAIDEGNNMSEIHSISLEIVSIEDILENYTIREPTIGVIGENSKQI